MIPAVWTERAELADHRANLRPADAVENCRRICEREKTLPVAGMDHGPAVFFPLCEDGVIACPRQLPEKNILLARFHVVACVMNSDDVVVGHEQTSRHKVHLAHGIDIFVPGHIMDGHEKRMMIFHGDNGLYQKAQIVTPHRDIVLTRSHGILTPVEAVHKVKQPVLVHKITDIHIVLDILHGRVAERCVQIAAGEIGKKKRKSLSTVPGCVIRVVDDCNGFIRLGVDHADLAVIIPPGVSVDQQAFAFAELHALLIGSGLPEKISLHFLTPDLAEKIHVLRRLHTLCQRMRADVLRHADGGGHDLPAHIGKLAQEFHVDLDIVEMVVLQYVER